MNTASPLMAMAAERVEQLCEPQMALLGDLIGLPRAESRAEAERRRPGRPAGARNRRSEDVARWVREEIGDLVMQQAVVAATPIDQLMAAGLSLKEAMEERRLSAALVLPYVEMRQPVRVDLATHRMVTLTIVDTPATATEGARSEVVQVLDIAQSDEGGEANV